MRSWSSNGSCGPGELGEDFLDLGLDLGLLERLPLNFVVTLRVDEILGAEHHDELAHVHFRDQHLLISLHYLAEIGRHGSEMAQMHVADTSAFGATRLER